MKHSLQLKLSQHLTLTPQLQQSIRLLQLSTLELNQELETILQENPLLERTDSEGANVDGNEPEFTGSQSQSETTPSEEPRSEAAPEPDLGTTSEDFQQSDWGDESAYGSGDETEDHDSPLAAESTTLRQHLLWQLNLSQIAERDANLVKLLIDALDEDGYLTQDLGELVTLLPPELEIFPIDLQIALKHLQNLDPPGVGARNLAECLTLQLEALPADTPYRNEAILLAKDHLAVMAARDYATLKKTLHLDDAGLRAVQSLITHLNPRPGAEFGAIETRYVIADVIVKKVKGMWTANLNPEAMPKLRINRMYADILSRSRDGNNAQLANQLQEAKWLIKNVQQRFDTILRVSQAIVDRQRHFFEHGDVAMRPLVLREIAESVDLHESTISRVTSQKFMLTPGGIYELKYFFGSHVGTDTGGEASATAIRALIKQMISAENPKKPLSDSQLSDVLGQQGLVVARRTVAKYREALQIPPVNLRKSL
jgi:RNA polymerase sigma-54 factor